jgi:hypothetical protein
MIIEKDPYWNNIVDYYYDEVHFEGSNLNVYDWLEDAYGAVSNTSKRTFEFNSDKKATWFALRWSQ